MSSRAGGIGRRELLVAAGAGVLRSIPSSARARGSPASSQIPGRLPTPPTPDLANLYEMMDWISRENQPRLSFLASRWRSLKEWKELTRPIFREYLRYNPKPEPLSTEVISRERRDGFLLEAVNMIPGLEQRFLHEIVGALGVTT